MAFPWKKNSMRWPYNPIPVQLLEWLEFQFIPPLSSPVACKILQIFQGQVDFFLFFISKETLHATDDTQTWDLQAWVSSTTTVLID